ncbi:MAG: aminopeptidase P family protein [Massiliimalia sp.]|jgi:Xaa-Pro aminopeptidase
MSKTNEILAQLRAAMKENGVSGYLIPSGDPHMSEYPPAYWESRSFCSGFNGSAGTLAVTLTGSALWTDGRYFIQAQRQIEDSEIQLMRQGEPGVPSISEWLLEQLEDGTVMGLDGMTNSAGFVQELSDVLGKKNITIHSLDLIPTVWADRPAMPATQCYLLDVAHTGKTAGEKIQELKGKLKELGADSMMVTRLDDIAWLLNVRADDVANTPYVLSFCLVEKEKAVFFTNLDRVPAQVKSELEKDGITLLPYEKALDAVKEISAPTAMLFDKAAVNYSLLQAMEENEAITVVPGTDPIQLMKGIKNPQEIKSIINAHVKDGIAMVRFQMELESRLEKGELLTEMDVSRMLRHWRSQQPLFLDESFVTIAAYGANAAMMHYHPTEENCSVIGRHGFLLCDCGGQYEDGTTDVTRTYAVGALSEEDKIFYTRVLKAHIGLSSAKFPSGITCGNIDALSRIQLWKEGLDYRCGTGHSVCFVGAVHEGPQSLRANNHVVLVPGMTLTDEPGIYEENQVGIRIENEILCKEWKKTEYGQFLCFEAFTYVPIDTTPLVTDLMTEEEISWLNDYHQMVLEKLTPHLTEEEKLWLQKKCAPVKK